MCLTIILQFQGAPLEFADVLADLNLIFTAMFTVECVLKISSFGPKVSLYFIIHVFVFVSLYLSPGFDEFWLNKPFEAQVNKIMNK